VHVFFFPDFQLLIFSKKYSKKKTAYTPTTTVAIWHIFHSISSDNKVKPLSVKITFINCYSTVAR